MGSERLPRRSRGSSDRRPPGSHVVPSRRSSAVRASSRPVPQSEGRPPPFPGVSSDATACGADPPADHGESAESGLRGRTWGGLDEEGPNVFASTRCRGWANDPEDTAPRADAAPLLIAIGSTGFAAGTATASPRAPIVSRTTCRCASCILGPGGRGDARSRIWLARPLRARGPLRDVRLCRPHPGDSR